MSDRPVGSATDCDEAVEQSSPTEIATLMRIAAALNGSIDIASSLHVTLALVAEYLRLDAGWVWLLDESDDETPVLAAAMNLPPGLVERPDLLRGSCYCLDTFRCGDLTGAANINVVACSRLRWLGRGDDGLRFHASVPISRGDQKLGVLNVASTTWRSLSRDELAILHATSDMLAVAIERARLYEKSVEAGMLKERNRIAREIHDSLAQSLAGVILALETAAELLPPAAEAAAAGEFLRSALGSARRSLEEARRAVQDLRSSDFAGRDLEEALRNHCNELERIHGITPMIIVKGDLRGLAPSLEHTLFRIAQEALNNALRHASPASVSIEVDAAGAKLRMAIRDDGTGMPAAPRESGGFGLIGMSERARLVGADLVVSSESGRGTTVEVEVPIPVADSPIRLPA